MLTVFITLTAIITTIRALSIFSKPNHDGSNWAVLIAGSNGYYNYRHQSDIAHSYQILNIMDDIIHLRMDNSVPLIHFISQRIERRKVNIGYMKISGMVSLSDLNTVKNI